MRDQREAPAFTRGVDIAELNSAKLSDRFARIAKESNEIEGNPLSLSETIVCSYYKTYLPTVRIDHQREAFNHVNALWFAYGALDKPLTPFFIRELHEILMIGVLDTAGAYRTGPVIITGASRQPPHAIQVPPEMDALCTAWAAGKMDTEAAILFHSCFELIHPFEDGNGRVGRVLLAWMMMRQGIMPPILLASDRARYIDALDSGDLALLETVLFGRS